MPPDARKRRVRLTAEQVDARVSRYTEGYADLHSCPCPVDECDGRVEYGSGANGHSCSRCMRTYGVERLVQAAFDAGREVGRAK